MGGRFCRILAGGFLLACALVQASYARPPTYYDPFDPSRAPADQSVTGSAPAGPSVRVLLSGATRASMKDMADWANFGDEMLNPASLIDQVDPRHIREDLNRILAPRFRSIEYAYADAPPSRTQVDYVLKLDINVTLGKHSLADNSVDLQGVLSGPDGQRAETFAGHGTSTVGFLAFRQHVTEAKQAAFDEFARNLDNSSLLAAYRPATPSPSGGQTVVADTAPTPPAGNSTAAGGDLYDIESRIPFNVLDSVYFDAASGELALIGHHDDRFKGPAIPYLQYLATLLENPKPEFSLVWTPDSSDRVDAMLARELTQRESDEQAARLGAMIDNSGLISHVGSLMLPPLGIYPVSDNRAPGDLGVEVQSINGGRVVIMKVKPGSAAERAGLKPADFIVSVRPDRPVFFAAEFERQVRFAGAGAQIEVSYQRDGEMRSATAILDAAADPDPWRGVNRYDMIELMYRLAGDPAAADVIAAMGIENAVSAQNVQTARLKSFTGFMHALGMDADFQHLQVVGATSAPPYEDSYNFSLKICRQLDSIFHFAGNPLQNSFESTVRSTHDAAGAFTQAFNQFDVQVKPKIGELFDRLIFRPGVGFQIPPELVEDEYHIHPEMTPEYRGVPADSQLARLMLASDYLGKQLSNRQDLKRKIPGYQTQIEYQITHPEAGHGSNSAFRMWISVAHVNAAQSTDGKVLALRPMQMRFNLRQTDSRANDLPNQQPGGYEDVLTGLYDRFEQEFSTLHELREAAALAAVAVWMQKQNPAIRLPAEGRTAWQGPQTVAGLVYIYLTVNLNHESKVIKIAEGGVSLVPFPMGNGAAVFPTDASVVDLRGTPAMATVFVRPDGAAVRNGSTDTGASPYVAGWVAPIAGGTAGQNAVVLQTRLASLPNPPSGSVAAAAGSPSEAIPTCKRSEPIQPEPGTVSPASFVTQAQCESASSEIIRLQKLRDNLAKKIIEVQGWGAGLAKDEKEFADMRADAQLDLGWEFIEHLPVSEILGQLKKVPALKNIDFDKIALAYEAAIGLIQTGRGVSANDDRKKADEILGGNRALTNAMIDASGVDKKSKALLEAVSKIIDYGEEVAVAASDDKRDNLKSVMTLVEILQPWWGLGVLAENLGERGGQYYEAGVALDSLHKAQSANWNAQRYLSGKLDRVNDEIKEEQFIVQKYQMANAPGRQ